MAVGAVSNNNPSNVASGTTTDTDARKTGSSTLDVNDFLSLITVQLTNQDPLKPMEDTQFISQMASFTSLQQMQTLSKDFADYTASSKMVNAQSYLGKTVTLSTDAGIVTGPVTKVTSKDGAIQLTVGGKNYDPAYVTSVSATAAAATTPTTPTTPTTGS